MSQRPTPFDLHDFIAELKKEILEETKRAYGEKAFHRWTNPLYEGALPSPDGYACRRNSCGDSMELFLKFDGERVSQASFRTAGCGAGAVCGSYAAEIALHRSPEEILQITDQSILERLGGLPREEEPVATLAVETLHAALRNFIRKQKERDEKKSKRGHS